MNEGKGRQMEKHFWIGGYSLAILFVFGTVHARESPSIETSAPVQIESQDVINRSIRGLPPGFPAISESGDELAVFHSSNTHVDEAVLYIVRVADKMVVNRFVFVSEISGIARGYDASFERYLEGVVTEANGYLADGDFAAIPLLYEIPLSEAMASTDGELWTTTSDGYEAQFNASSGEIIISKQGDCNRTWRMRRPLEVFGPQGGHPFNFCQVQGTPYRGWISESEDILVINIGFLAGTDRCGRSDEWVIQQLSETGYVRKPEMGLLSRTVQ